VTSFLSDKEIQENLLKKYHKSVSKSTISRHLHEYGYRNVLPQTTHMLTADKKTTYSVG
jgi:arginine repressor